MADPEHQRRHIREYVEIEAPDETITHLEKVKTEHVFGEKHDCWDVWTDKNRWWVITNLTNLYNQSEFESLDYALTLHIGVRVRLSADPKSHASSEEKDFFQPAWRQLEGAAVALDEAEEAVEFQAVGMMLRQCLLNLVREVGKPEMVTAGEEPPKAADFVGWADIIADTVAAGQRGKPLRAFMKKTSGATWQLVNWLTHAAHATSFDGAIALGAAENLVHTLGTALMRYERGSPERCPACTSYRVVSDYRKESDRYVKLCEACGWTEEGE